MAFFKVKEIAGIKSLRAMNTFHVLMLGMKMLPMYLAEPYQEFLERVEKMDEAGKRAVLLEATRFVNLEDDDIKSMIYFCEDINGVAFTDANMKKLKPDQIMQMIIEVSLKIAEIKVDMIRDAEKKN